MNPCILPGRKGRLHLRNQAHNLPVPELHPKTVAEAVDRLQVETSLRYRKHGADTYCRTFASDVADSLGFYLPIVWWNDLERPRGEPEWGLNCRELDANACVGWAAQWGRTFWDVALVSGGTHRYSRSTIKKAAQAYSDARMLTILLFEAHEGHGHAQVVLMGGHSETELRVAQAGITNSSSMMSGLWKSDRYKRVALLAGVVW